jgi:hypothetical protein
MVGQTDFLNMGVPLIGDHDEDSELHRGFCGAHFAGL